MDAKSSDVIECGSISVKCDNGEIIEFPVVDNKGLFPNFFRTAEKFRFQVQCYLVEGNTYALYKRVNNIAYLLCAWNKKEEINNEALELISSKKELSYLLN